MAQMRLFISYSRKDAEFAHRLLQDLRAAGYEVWIDVRGLRGGQKWARGIDAAVRDCDAFLVIVSPDSMASEWVGKETLLAQGLKKLIIPIMYREINLPVHLVDLHWVDFRDKYDEAMQALIEALASVGSTPPPPTSLPDGRTVVRGRGRPLRLPAWAWGVSVLVVIAAGIAAGFAAGLLKLPTSPKTPPAQTTPGRGFVVDNADPGFVIEAGDWRTCPDGGCGGVCYGADFWFVRPGCNTCRARFDFAVPAAGEYDLWTWWPKGEDRATDTPFIVLHGGVPFTVTVNQRDLGDAWYRLGTFTFDPAESVSIVVTGSNSGYANADAIAVTRAGSGPPGADLGKTPP